MTDIVQGLTFENGHSVNMEDLKPGVVIYQQEAEAISSRVMDVFHSVEAENCVERHFARLAGFAIIRRPGATRNMGRAPSRGRGWKKNVTSFELLDSRYDNPEVFYQIEVFERVLGTDWDGAKEMVRWWRTKPDVRCRPWHG